jgi:hypothetical protein
VQTGGEAYLAETCQAFSGMIEREKQRGTTHG